MAPNKIKNKDGFINKYLVLLHIFKLSIKVIGMLNCPNDIVIRMLHGLTVTTNYATNPKTDTMSLIPTNVNDELFETGTSSAA